MAHSKLMGCVVSGQGGSSAGIMGLGRNRQPDHEYDLVSFCIVLNRWNIYGGCIIMLMDKLYRQKWYHHGLLGTHNKITTVFLYVKLKDCLKASPLCLLACPPRNTQCSSSMPTHLTVPLVRGVIGLIRFDSIW